MALVDTGVGLQLRCALSECEALDIAGVTTTVEAGDMGIVNGTPGVYVTSLAKALSDLVAFIFKAPAIVLPCTIVTTGNLSSYAQGDVLYYKSSTGKLDPTASGNTKCAIVLESAAIGDTTVLVRLDGTMAK